VANPEGKRPLHVGLEDNIKTDVREIRVAWSGMDWIHPGQNRDQWRALVNTVMKVGFY
jgi:hypothetical protein